MEYNMTQGRGPGSDPETAPSAPIERSITMDSSAELDVWPRIKQAIYATTVSRAAIDFEWPECHRKNCQMRHGSPDEAFHIFAKRVADNVYGELISRCISDPDRPGEVA